MINTLIDTVILYFDMIKRWYDPIISFTTIISNISIFELLIHQVFCVYCSDNNESFSLHSAMVRVFGVPLRIPWNREGKQVPCTRSMFSEYPCETVDCFTASKMENIEMNKEFIEQPQISGEGACLPSIWYTSDYSSATLTFRWVLALKQNKCCQGNAQKVVLAHTRIYNVDILMQYLCNVNEWISIFLLNAAFTFLLSATIYWLVEKCSQHHTNSW